MKTLILLRHAEAAELQSGQDAQRPLTQKGREMAVWVGNELTKKGLWPDFILSSSVQRTKETCGLLQEAWTPDVYPQVFFDPAIYRADAHECLEMIAMQDEMHSTLMMVGHNPSIHQLALLLCGAGQIGKKPELASNFPPASCVVLTFPQEQWVRIHKGSGTLVDFFHPAGL